MSRKYGVVLTPAAWLLAMMMVGVLLTAPDEAAAVKLNPALVAGGAVLDFQPTPDGNRVVYLADQETNGVAELYSVAVNGGPATKLNKPLVAGGAVKAFSVTPDGSRVVFTADQDFNDIVEIYSVPVAGGPITRLNDELMHQVGGSVRSFQLTEDGSRVVFLADQDTKNHVEIYSAPVAGGARTKVNGHDIVIKGSVVAFQISADGSRVVFRGDVETAGLIELYSAPIAGAGGPITKLNPPLLTGEDIAGFEITPNGTQVVYRAAQENEEVIELYIVPITGGTAPQKLNGPLPAGFEVSGFQITPDGSRVIYRGRLEIEQPPPADEIVVIEIYSVSLTGGPATATKLNTLLPSGGSVVEFRITPDSSRVVYLADQEVDQRFELYSVPVQGGVPTKLNPPLVAGGSVLRDSTSTVLLNEGFLITPDSSRVVYRADQTTDNVNELFSVPVGGGAVTRLNPSLLSGRDVAAFLITSDGTEVVYLADQDDNGTNELYRVPVTGGQAVKISQSLPTGRTIIGFEIGLDGSQITYVEAPFRTTPPHPDPVQELHSVGISSFVDVSPDDVFLPWIEALVDSGITGGCGTNPARFCPNLVLTRAQMAVLLVRGIDGPGVTPPAADGTTFVDVAATDFGAAHIERLFELGITAGCQASPRRFCPDQGLTRAQMATFLLRAAHGAGYDPPAATGTAFTDVPASHPFAEWIEQLAREGITGGCATNPARFCPEQPLTRGQIAVFLTRTFHLPF